MRSPLELISPHFDHALFTTYTLNLGFFERWVMPLLAGAGVRNVLVFADANSLGEALEDPHLKLAGRRYQVFGVDAPAGVFHSKLILLTSKDHVRLCVSSANLTVSGQLRNLESAAAFDSSLPGHLQVIASAADYFARIAEGAPSHFVDAVAAATGTIEADDLVAPARFVHNLDSELVNAFPSEGLKAVAPFADAAAARRLSAIEPLRLIVDGDRFEAPSGFFEEVWEVQPRLFDRPLHGKAHGSLSEEWTLVGSPNVTGPALLRPAKSGNYEAAVVFPVVLPEPPSEPWRGEPVSVTAPRRRESAGSSKGPGVAAPGVFDAWEESGAVIVGDLPEGTPVEFASNVGWIALGSVHAGRLDVPEGVVPYRLRAWIGRRPFLAVVHRPLQLRSLLRIRHKSPASHALEGPIPLDIEGQRALQGVLDDLMALVALIGEERVRLGASRPRPTSTADGGRLTDWLPANPEDEPRIPELYTEMWAQRRDPDVLAALVRMALRLRPIEDAPGDVADEDLVRDEAKDLDDLDGEDEEVNGPEESPDELPRTSARVLNAFRKNFMSRLDQSAAVIAEASEPDLAGLVLQTVLRIHERLSTEVNVDGRAETLIEPEQLLRQKLEVIRAYLKRREDDPSAMLTIRFHVAECLRNREVWSPLDWERLEEMTYDHGMRIVTTPLPPQHVEELSGMALEDAEGWIEELAARTDWGTVEEHARGYLSEAQLRREPFPHVIGTAGFSEIGDAPIGGGSPAWDLMGYGAVAGFADDDSYGVAVVNSRKTEPYSIHAVVIAPAENRLYEAVRRSRDRTWMWRYYQPVGRALLEEAAKLGPIVLGDAFRSPFRDSTLVGLPDPLQPVVEAAVKGGW